MTRFRNISSGVEVDVPSRPSWDRWEKLDGTHAVLPDDDAPDDDAPDDEPAGDPAGDPSVPGGDGVPDVTASRAEWAAYAATKGIEPGTLTRAQLRTAVAGL